MIKLLIINFRVSILPFKSEIYLHCQLLERNRSSQSGFHRMDMNVSRHLSARSEPSLARYEFM